MRAVIGLLTNPTLPEAGRMQSDAQEAARTLGRELRVLDARDPSEIDAAFASLRQRPVGALLVSSNPFFSSRRQQIVALAAGDAIPAMYFNREFVADGGLMSYGNDIADAYRRAGVYVGRILNGAKPADLPVDQATKFEFVINLKTAKRLGIVVPPGLSRKRRRGDRMKRREFIGLAWGAALASLFRPLGALAQQAQIRTIGLLGSGTASSQATWVAAFVQRLRELGWVEGRNVRIEYRWVEGHTERFAEIAAEFVRLKVDVIFALGTEAALAAKQATADIPIVFPVAGDPIATGIVASLSRPGGNVTGLSNLAADLAAKRLGILRELAPGLGRLAIMFNGGSPASVLEMNEFEAAARTLGVEAIPMEVRGTDDIAPALVSLKGRAQALYVVGDPLMNFNRVRINTFALVARLPTMYVQREYVEAAGLMSYGANYPDLNRRAGDYVDKILRGTKPADLPVEQPTKFDLVINLITAQALGLTIPPTLLARADEVIE